MKSKKRHQSSSEETEESEASEKSSSSSESESEESSESGHRHKKKRKRADSSQSASDSDGQKRSKKRKHKKKKKKHGKKKRRSDSVQSISVEEISMSEGEISSKNKRKHKHRHSKRDRSSSASAGEGHIERRLHSVVKERRASSEENSQPSRTYYQRDYRHAGAGEEPEYDREREVQRFYRGSSKDRAQQRYEYERERNNKYASYQDKNYRPKYGQSAPYGNSHEEYNQKQKQYDEYRRHQRYEDRRPNEQYQARTREDYHSKEDTRGYNQNRYNQHSNPYEGPKRPYNDNREYHRRAPPESAHYREREYPDKRERYQERYPTDRPREVRPHKPPVRTEKTVPTPRSRSPDDRYKSRAEPREERDDRYREREGRDNSAVRRDSSDVRRDNSALRRDNSAVRRDKSAVRRDNSALRRDNSAVRRESSDVRRDGRGDERPPRTDRSHDRSKDRPPVVKTETRPRDRRSKFDGEENKEYSWGKTEVKKEESTAGDKEKPNFGLSGKLTEEANTYNGVVIKYSEPDDAKQPKRRWRFYPFKGDKALPILYIHRQSAFLIGRDKKVVDIMLEHPSVSKQHAALQYRATPFSRPDGSQGRRVRPYIIDLDSANGTFVNNKKIDPRRYVELLERDVVKFGFSQREYVLLHENSKDDAQDDDNQEAPELGAAVTLTEKIKQEKRAKQEVAEDGE